MGSTRRSFLSSVGTALFACLGLPRVALAGETPQLPIQWGAPSDGFAISVTLATQPFVHGNPMLATISIKNVSAGNVVLQRPEDDFNYELTVVQNGRVIAKRAPDGKTFYVFSGTRTATLNNGGVDTETISLDKAYDLSPGSYTLMVSLPLKFIGKVSHATVAAPPVTFTVA
jgi:hypothetical protein